MNLYTYCRNNPIRYVDPSGHSYGLINGEKFSINSAWDAKRFNELKSGKSSSSQVATTTVPKAFDSPITGGISKQLTSTTTYTTVITDTQISTSKKNTNMFSRSINWIDENIATPFVNGTVKFGKAVYHSTSFELGMGFGLGAEGKLGCINGSALVVPIRNEYIIADDCKTNSTSKFSIGADFGEIFGLGAEAKCFAYNGDKDGVSWLMPGHEWDYQAGFISKNSDCTMISNQEDDPHFTLSIGGSVYLFIGGDVSLSFDVNTFCEYLGE